MRKTRFYDFGPFRIDCADRRLLSAGTPVPLTPKVFDTLLALVENSPRLIEKGELMQAVWPDSFVAESSLTFNISVLRKVLARHGDERPYIETVPKRGYRFVADVAQVAGAAPREGGKGRKTIAILPFRSLVPESEYRYLGLGLADTLITRLSNISQLLVRPTSAVVRYDRADQDPVMAGSELGVESVLEGTIRAAGDRVRVIAQLVDVERGATVWAEKFDEKLTDLFAVEDSIAEKLTPALMLTIDAAEREMLRRRFTESIEAHHAYLKGRYYWNKQTPEGLRKAVAHFEQATAIDPGYALAYAGLADAYDLIGIWGGAPPAQVLPKAMALALKAIEIDERLAEAHAALGGAMATYERDWEGAEKEFKRAIEINPGYATAHHAYAMVCLLPSGRLDEALAAVSRARELDPLSLFINASVAMILNYAGRYDEAIELLQKLIDLEPNYYLSHWVAGYAYEQEGEHERAIEAYQRARDLSGANSSTTKSLGHLYGALGREEEARRLLNDLEARARRDYVSPYDVAGIHAGLGDKGRAIELLERAYEERSGVMVWLNLDNTFKSLRSEPSFKDLLRRMRLVA
jgi:TolB-like protein/Tfp pilus assembly protein PilF